jgi:hypothetical protein
MPAIDRIEHFIWTQHVATVVTGAWRFEGSNDRLGQSPLCTDHPSSKFIVNSLARYVLHLFPSILYHLRKRRRCSAALVANSASLRLKPNPECLLSPLISFAPSLPVLCLPATIILWTEGLINTYSRGYCQWRRLALMWCKEF